MSKIVLLNDHELMHVKGGVLDFIFASPLAIFVTLKKGIKDKLHNMQDCEHTRSLRQSPTYNSRSDEYAYCLLHGSWSTYWQLAASVSIQ